MGEGQSAVYVGTRVVILTACAETRRDDVRFEPIACNYNEHAYQRKVVDLHTSFFPHIYK